MKKATVLMGVPTFYVRLLESTNLSRDTVANMRLFISGSAPLLAETHKQWQALTGTAILERYGMTETNMNTSNPYDGERRAGTVGMPLPGIEVRITDQDTGKELAQGEIGSIEVRGPNVFKGYWQMPEKTKEEFREDGFFITGDVGGSFGAKARPFPEEVLLGWLARRIGRPVKWVPPRSDDMVGLGHGRGQIQYCKIGGSRDGNITTYQLHVVQESGAYPAGGAGLPSNARAMLTGCYKIPSVGFSSVSVVTNTTPTGAYRGAGRPEAAAAIERAVDAFARDINMDPAEVRRKNFLQPHEFPLVTPTGSPYDSGEYEATLDAALEANNFPEISRLIHKIRPSTGNMGVLSIQSKMKTLEKIAKETQNKQKITATYRLVKKTLQHVISQLQKNELNV